MRLLAFMAYPGHVPVPDQEGHPAMKKSITKRTIDALKIGKRDYWVWDTTLTGFGVRVRKSGAMTYVAQYTAGNYRHAPVRRVTLAQVGKVTPDEARALAKDVLARAVRGEDPARERSDDRKAETVADLAKLFLAEVKAKKKPRTFGHYDDVLNRLVVPELGKVKANKVTITDVAALHRKLAGTPYQANRMLAVVSSMYGYAAKHRIVPRGFNPAEGIEKYTEHKRETFLTRAQLEALGDAIREATTTGIPYLVDEAKAKHAPKPENRLTKVDPHAIAAVLLLIFTGARLREILHLKWQDVDFEWGFLRLPDSKTGQKAIILNSPAVAVLSSIPRIGVYVVAGATAGTKDEKPRADLKRPWKALAKRAGLPGVRIHDLRHTHASYGAGAGLGLPIIGKLLGHTQASTTQRYAHLDADPLRIASNRIGTDIAAAMGEINGRGDGHEVMGACERR
jgi:integrase